MGGRPYPAATPRELVPKLCLGTHLEAKLYFADVPRESGNSVRRRSKQSFSLIDVPKHSLGTSS